MSDRHRATREEYQARHLADGESGREPVEPAQGVECYPIGHMDDARRDPRLYAGVRS
jgi:hypothetical protein